MVDVQENLIAILQLAEVLAYFEVQRSSPNADQRNHEENTHENEIVDCYRISHSSRN